MAEPLSTLENPTKTKTKKIQVTSSTFLFTISLSLLSVSLLCLSSKDTTFWFLLSNAIIFFVVADSNASSPTKSKPDVYDEYLKNARSRNAYSLYTYTSSFSVSPSPGVAQEKKETEAFDKNPSENVNSGDGYPLSESEKVIVAIESKKNVSQQQSDIRCIAADSNNTISPSKSKPDLCIDYSSSNVSPLLPHPHYSICESSSLEIPPEKKELVALGQDPSKNAKSSGQNYCRSESQKAIVAVDSKEKVLSRSRTGNGSRQSEDSDFSDMSNEELNRRVEEFIKRFNRQIRLQELRERSGNQDI